MGMASAYVIESWLLCKVRIHVLMASMALADCSRKLWYHWSGIACL